MINNTGRSIDDTGGVTGWNIHRRSLLLYQNEWDTHIDSLKLSVVGEALGVTLSTTNLELDEGEKDSYTLALVSQPTGDVIVSISETTNPDVTVSPATRTFTVDSWATPQPVEVSTVRDADTTNDDGTVTHTVSGGGYGAAEVDDVGITVTDDGIVDVTVRFDLANDTVAEDGTVDVVVRLNKDPERNLVIPITTSDQGDTSSLDYSVPLSVTFESGETEKEITFSATQDIVDDDDESVILGFDSSGSTWPSQVSPGTQSSTTVRIDDDDDPTVTVNFEQTSYSVAEGSDGDVYVMLDVEPERSVTITLTATNQGATSADYGIEPSSLSLTFLKDETRKMLTFSALRATPSNRSASARFRTPRLMTARACCSGSARCQRA